MSSLALPRARAVPIAYAYGLVGVVGSTVLAVSGFYLYKLAEAVHMPAGLAWSLPVALDAGAAFGTVCWIIADDESETRRFGRAFALSCLAGTLAGNGLAHLLDFHEMRVTSWLAVGTGAVYPVVLFAIVHLVLLLRREQSAMAGELGEVVEDASAITQPVAFDASPIDPPAPWRTVEASPINPPVVGVPADESADTEAPTSKRRRPSTAASRRRWINAELDAARDVTGGQVERRYGSRNGAREVAQVKAERAQRAAVNGTEVA